MRPDQTDHKVLIFFVPESVICFLRLLHITKCTPGIFFLDANTMNPDQTAP